MQEHNGRDRAYYAQRAAEEFDLAEAAGDGEAAAAHRKLQKAYLERASVGAREMPLADEIG
ncbi:MAG TPA: hypothetical protein VFI88_07740 [Sphingomicrobium sp.]|jgi:hypothetical protein|nr:hypothetical protein [Sphingomicrobium sp.]